MNASLVSDTCRSLCSSSFFCISKTFHAAHTEEPPAARKVVCLVRMELVGALPGPPLRSLVTASTPSSTPSKTVESWTWASVSTAASGTSLRSTGRWGLEPGRAQKDANHYEVLGDASTAEEARTSLLAPDSRRLYLAAPDYGGQSR